MPKVLFAVFQTGNRANGGVESISQVIDAIDSPCVVVTQMETPVNQRWGSTGKAVYVFKLPYRVGDSFSTSSVFKKLNRLWSLVGTNWTTARLIRRHKVQLIHCNDPAPFWHLAPAALLTKTPIVLNLRDTKSDNNPISRSKYVRKFRFSKVVLVLSREMIHFYRQVAGEDFFQRHNILLQSIYSVVDFERMQPPDPATRRRIRTELQITDKEIAIGYVAAFNDKKNQLEFIKRAGPQLKNRLPHARVFFVGDFRPESDSYAEHCREAVDALDVNDKFVFAGFTAAVENWYRSLDIVIVPTRQEGMARCMIEAMACGIPIISFDVCSAHEILTEHDCGIVVPQGDYSALIDTIAKLSNDAAARHRMGSNGYATARKLFQRARILSQYIDLYRQVVSPEARPSTPSSTADEFTERL